MAKIKKIIGRQVFDSRGNPTVEAEVFSKNISAKAICPSGASTGKNEAFELRDKKKSYHGKSVLKAVDNVNTVIFDTLSGYDVLEQEEIDETLIELDGTPNKKMSVSTVGLPLLSNICLETIFFIKCINIYVISRYLFFFD